MEIPTALLIALERLSESVDQTPAFLTAPLVELGRELEGAVGNIVGVQVTIFTELGLPITLTDFGSETDLSTIATSLRVPLEALTSWGSTGHITFFGGRRGSFVDLAADLTFVLGSVRPDGAWPPVTISVDEHLQPSSTQASLVGTEEASMVNRAIGLLIGRGRTPDEAETELVVGAQDAGLSMPAFADRILRLAQSTR